METDGIECMNKYCSFHHEDYECSCTLGEEPSTEGCEDFSSSVLFRRFSPVSTYEPDPKREGWQNWEDCCQCPYFDEVWNWPNEDINGDTLDGACDLQPDCEWIDGKGYNNPLGDPSFCRFSEYRRILFQDFRDV